jgi:glucose-1-phosphate cytidylyltransferase
MKTVILAGGYGTRLSEETAVRPKPMVNVGGRPILWHIMKIYSAFGITDFVVCCGYQGHVIKQYFADYFLNRCDLTFDLANNRVEVHRNGVEPWRVTLVDTGDGTMTGGRLKRVRQYLDDESFCMTYGDGVSNVDIRKLIEFHRDEGRWATLLAVQPPGRFGAFSMGESDTGVRQFREKSPLHGAWVNGGFFVLEPQVLDLIEGDDTVWEREPLEELAHLDQLSAFRHDGFWQPMDTLRDKTVLEELWSSGSPPWRVWDSNAEP